MGSFASRIRHAWKWRWDLYGRPAWTRWLIETRWRFAGRGRPHGLPGELIVSLTSYPPRFPTLAPCLRSLLRQTVRADRTILWIAEGDMKALPEEVLALRQHGLDIRSTQDLGPYKKIIPSLEAFPGAYICTADDDVYYWPTWLEALVAAARSGSNIVACHRAHRVKRNDDGSYRPYAEWTFNVSDEETSRQLFPTGVGGVLYSPGTLAHTDDDLTAISRCCPKNDDLWLYWIGRRNGVTYKNINPSHDLFELTDVAGLWHTNVDAGRNDTSIRDMASVYGYPPVD